MAEPDEDKHRKNRKSTRYIIIAFLIAAVIVMTYLSLLTYNTPVSTNLTAFFPQPTGSYENFSFSSISVEVAPNANGPSSSSLFGPYVPFEIKSPNNTLPYIILESVNLKSSGTQQISAIWYNHSGNSTNSSQASGSFMYIGGNGISQNPGILSLVKAGYSYGLINMSGVLAAGSNLNGSLGTDGNFTVTEIPSGQEASMPLYYLRLNSGDKESTVNCTLTGNAFLDLQIPGSIQLYTNSQIYSISNSYLEIYAPEIQFNLVSYSPLLVPIGAVSQIKINAIGPPFPTFEISSNYTTVKSLLNGRSYNFTGNMSLTSFTNLYVYPEDYYRVVKGNYNMYFYYNLETQDGMINKNGVSMIFTTSYDLPTYARALMGILSGALIADLLVRLRSEWRRSHRGDEVAN